MSLEASFPIYIFEKDDWSMFLADSPDTVLYNVEPFDLENDEYLFWDAQGRSVTLTFTRGKLTGIDEAPSQMTLREAFAKYCHALGLTVEIEGPFAEVWTRLEKAISEIPPKPSLLARLFGRKSK